MSIQNTQSFQLALSTSTGYTVVAGSGCETCSGVPTYNASASSTSQSLSESSDVSILNSTVDTTFYKEDCGMREANGETWEYPDQTVIIASNSSSIFSDTVSGVLGLGINSAQGNFSDTLFGGWLSRNPFQTNFTFGMALNSPVGGSLDGGYLYLIEPDTSAYTGDVTSVLVQGVAPNNSTDTNTTTPSASGDVSQEWVVQMEEWTFSAGITNVQNTQGGSCAMDPYFPNIYFPLNQAQQIYDGIPNATLNQLVNNMQTWSVPCDTAMNLAITLGGQRFAVDETTLVVNLGNGECYGVVEGWADTSIFSVRDF